MKIFFTGGSSFTGSWFIRELAAGGHKVVATFRRRPEEYEDELRHTRASILMELCRPAIGCAFGQPEFLDLVRNEGGFDLLCHHAADVTNYRSPDFNTVAAVANNTHNLPNVLDALKAAGCGRVLLTGSFFEQGEGAGSDGLPAFSPYGLSKGLTAEVFRYYMARAAMNLGKFVIPNPFGPFEPARFTSYLMKTWRAGQTASVSTPLYVRDNIHVTLLAKAYRQFAEKLAASQGFLKINPSGYAESQAAFATRYAAEMRARLPLECRVEMKTQTDFSEPRVRINTDVLDPAALGWNESAAWDEIAQYNSQPKP
jgi:nucleoside-diphosphate-sugar epimerase